jgi:hypothetical protein
LTRERDHATFGTAGREVSLTLKEIEIRVARTLCEVEALREPWTAWPGHRDSDIDFYLTILQSRPEIVRPHVIALYRDGKPDTILVGRLERKPSRFRIGYLPRLGFRVRCLTFVHGALRGNASAENTWHLLQEVMNCLRRDEADVAMLDDVSIDSPLYRLALKLPGALSRDTLPELQGHEVMTVPESIKEVLECMSAHRRHELRRTAKKLQSNPVGEPRLVCYRDPAELDHLFHDAEEIARKTYQRGLGVGFADTVRVRKRLELAALKGWLRAYLLYLGDRPCAFWIGMLYGETFVSDYTAYDPEFRQFSPGIGLVMRMIERFCNRADGDVIAELDFGPGDAEYKAVLCTTKWLEAVVYIFSPTLRGVALKSIRTATRVVNVVARKVLTSTKLASWARRAWRGRLAKHAEKTPPKN